MPSDLSNYLATRYLVADPKPTKKRKRKQDASSSSTGLIIADDDADASGWTRASQNPNDDEDSAVVAGTSAEFRKAKKSAWKVVGGSANQPSSSAADASASTSALQDLDSARRADAILASAAAEASSAQASASADDAPQVLMSDGTHAGLQTASSVAAQLAARRQAERTAFASSAQKEAETVYRDATGRRVDVSLKRAELRRAAAEAAKAEDAKRNALKGEVQVEAARRRREELEDAKVMGVARHADDLDLNREMKEQVRWGDTMAQFIEPRGGGGGSGGSGRGGSGEVKKKMKGKPVYKGAWAPNRYGIRPGYRWDGVDRGNGFEAERFKAINRRERNKGLEYSWQMDE